MNIKILTILVIPLMFLIGLCFIKNYLFSMDNQNVWLEWQSKLDAPNLWERWDKGPKINVRSSKYSEEDLIKYYYEDKINPEKKILDYKYKTYKGSIILDYRQIKIQDKEEWEQNRIKWHGNKNNPWTYGVSMNRGLIIQILVPKKFKDKFLEDGWKIVKMNISNFGSKKEKYSMQKIEVYKIEVSVYEDESNPDNFNKVLVGEIIERGERGGKLELSIITPGEAASRLQKAFADITSQKSLKDKIHVSRKIDGHVVNVLTRIDVSPDDPGYIWAVARSLKGFICNVVINNQKEEHEPIKVKLSVVAASSEVIATLTFTNTSSNTVYIEKINGCINGILENDVFEITTIDRKNKISYVGILAKRRPPGLDDYVRLAPGGSLSTEVNLNEVYEFLPGSNDYYAVYTALHSYPDHSDYMELVSNEACFQFSK